MHYVRVTEADYERATGLGLHDTGVGAADSLKAAQKAARSVHETRGNELHPDQE